MQVSGLNSGMRKGEYEWKIQNTHMEKEVFA